MIIPINKTGNLEFEYNTARFRMPLSSLDTEDLNLIEKGIKRKVKELEFETNYLIPQEIKIVNSSVIFYYDMSQYKSFSWFRHLTFESKLKYYSSLIQIAKKQEITKVIWEQFNFVIDPANESIKVIVFESETIKINEKEDPFNGVKELILLSLTSLNIINGKPKRSEFLDQDDYVIQFAETLLKIDNLDDLDDFISTKQIEYKNGVLEDTDSTELDDMPKTKKKFAIKKPKNTKKQVINHRKKGKAKGNSNSNKSLIILFAILGVVLVLNTIVKANVPDKNKTTTSKAPTTEVKKEAKPKN